MTARIAAACGGQPQPSLDLPTSIGDGEGELNLVIWAGYAERGAVDPAYDWVTPFEDDDRLQGQHDRHDRLEQRRLAHAVGRLRRHLGLRRRDDPAHPAATSSPRSTRRCSPNYANVFDGPQGPAPQHGRRRQLRRARTAAARTCSPTTPTRSRRRRPAGIRSGRAARPTPGKVSVYDSSIFIADAALHLMTTKPDLGHHEPVPAQPGAVRRGDRPARGAARQRRHLLGPAHRPGPVVRRRRRRRRHDLAVPGQPAPGATAQPDRGRPARRGLDRLVRHLDDRQEGQAPELHVHVDGPHDVGRGQRPGDRLVRRGADEPGRPATTPRRISPGHCEQTHATDEAYYDEDLVLEPRRRPTAPTADASTTCMDQDDWVDGLDHAPRRLSLRLGASTTTRLPGSPRGASRPSRARVPTRTTHDRPPTSAPTAAARRPAPGGSPPGSTRGARLQLRLLLAGPLGWLAIVYLGSLAHPAAQRVLGQGRVHRQGRAVHVDPRRRSRRSSPTRSTGPSPSGRS